MDPVRALVFTPDGNPQANEDVGAVEPLFQRALQQSLRKRRNNLIENRPKNSGCGSNKSVLVEKRL
jgi:hypothetical protein